MYRSTKLPLFYILFVVATLFFHSCHTAKISFRDFVKPQNPCVNAPYSDLDKCKCYLYNNTLAPAIHCKRKAVSDIRTDFDKLAGSPISVLLLEELNLQTIPNNLFKQSFSVNQLYLISCNVKTVSLDAFKNISSVTHFTVREKFMFGMIEKESANTLKNFRLGSFKNLKYLDIRTSNIYNISQSDFSGLGNSLEELHVYLKKLGKIDESAFNTLSQLKELSIDSYEEINLNHKHFESLLNLEKLYISFPKLKLETDVSMFKHLTHLKYLDLQASSISILPSSAFDNMTQLLNLSLRYNSIDDIDGKFKLPNLEYLMMDMNDLTELSDHTFAYLPALKGVELTLNYINKVSAQAFSNNPKLEMIDLMFNKITKLPNDLFSGQPNLKFLLLNGNDIKNISSTLFRNNRNLKTINLNMNEITELNDSTIFASQSDNLEKLLLKSNRLRFIANGTLSRLTNLKKLDLSSNELKIFDPQEIIGSEETLTFLGLSNNKFVCDCNMLPFKLWYETWLDKIENEDDRDRQSKHMETVKCNGPPNLKDEILIQVPNKKFICASHIPDIDSNAINYNNTITSTHEPDINTHPSDHTTSTIYIAMLKELTQSIVHLKSLLLVGGLILALIVLACSIWICIRKQWCFTFIPYTTMSNSGRNMSKKLNMNGFNNNELVSIPGVEIHNVRQSENSMNPSFSGIRFSNKNGVVANFSKKSQDLQPITKDDFSNKEYGTNPVFEPTN